MSDIQADFLIPPEILAADFPMDPFRFGSPGFRPKPDSSSLCFRPEFPCSSPASALFPEFETDGGEFVSGLTRRLTRPCLDPSCCTCSPAPPRSEGGFWSGRSIGSGGNGRRNGLSATVAPVDVNDEAWNLIYQAAVAAQVARLKLNASGDGSFRNHLLPTANRSFSPAHPFHRARRDQEDEYILRNRQAKIELLNRVLEQELLQSRQNRVGSETGRVDEMRARQVPGPGQFVGWPPQRPENQSQFLPGAGKRERSGTGVFLPRNYDGNNPTDSLKKTAFPAVMHRGGIVPAVNKNLEDFTSSVQARPQLITDHDIMMSTRRQRQAAMLAHTMKNFGPDGAIDFELQLPQEWTY